MEQLQLEFEVAGSAKTAAFQEELEDKFKHMTTFKRAWGKFSLMLDAQLAKHEDLTEFEM